MKERGGWARIVTEVAVIVGSILLAFAIDAAWQGRQDAEAERHYLSLITRDLAALADEARSARAAAETANQAARTAFDALSGGPTLVDDELAELLEVAVGRYTMEQPRAGYTDLISTGNLRVIRDPELRDRIVRFYEATDRRYDLVRRNSEVFVDGLLVDALFGAGLITGQLAEPRAYEVRRDRLFSLSLDSEEVARLRTGLNQRIQRGGLAPMLGRLAEDADELRTEIAARLEREG